MRLVLDTGNVAGKMTKVPVLAEVTFLQWETNHKMPTAEPDTLRLCYAIVRSVEWFGWDGAACEGRKGLSEEMTLGLKPEGCKTSLCTKPRECAGPWGW